MMDHMDLVGQLVAGAACALHRNARRLKRLDVAVERALGHRQLLRQIGGALGGAGAQGIDKGVKAGLADHY